MVKPQDLPSHGFPADDVRKEEVAKAGRVQPLTLSHQGIEFKDGIKQTQDAA